MFVIIIYMYLAAIIVITSVRSYNSTDLQKVNCTKNMLLLGMIECCQIILYLYYNSLFWQSIIIIFYLYFFSSILKILFFQGKFVLIRSKVLYLYIFSHTKRVSVTIEVTLCPSSLSSLLSLSSSLSV